ncbi:tRNA lysidine(34) synthetase TilS [Sulfurihydrogenibium azorense]|uniref:tRNA lysidine(34) synthetase TilS n=1 Tax=Sulfurihydrogenibium azorense TaxID=309806 RepID=UPI00240A10B9|nr:tRNA lysidine(34) synthetase TilS [Sulfurihydrogenibium azorense]MDM7273362.1 tRNA lysidine(34) synthetase TilS [Sulfurihydrogenibium azorense]
MIEKKFLKAVEDFYLIQPKDKILIAFSGGPDSVVLSFLLKKFQAYFKIEKISLAHLNHSLREESDKDEEFCKDFGQKYDIPIFTKKVDVKSVAKKEKKSIEEAGREERYKFFKEIMEKENFNKLATAHHLSDLVETLFLWFIQGNKKGLKGFKPNEENIIRPLYYIKKEELLEYCHKNDLPHVIDKSNFDKRYLRNKVRLDLIPIAKEINHSLEESLLRLSFFQSLDEDFLEIYSKDILKSLQEKDYIDLNYLNTIHEAVKYRVITNWIYEKTGIYPSYQNILNILKLLKMGGTKALHLQENLQLIKEYDKLYLNYTQKVEKSYKEYKLKIGQTIFIKEQGISLTAFKPTEKDLEEMKKSKCIECFDIDTDEFTVRFRKEGDRFLPFGMKREKKLKDVFIDLKIPKNMRNSIPLLVFGDKILWIVGYKRSAYYPVTENSQNLICFKVKEEQNCN